MNFRCTEYLTRIIRPMRSGYQVCRPYLPVLFISNNFYERNTNIRRVSTRMETYKRKTGLLENLKRNLKFYLIKYRLRTAGYLLYESIVDQIDYLCFMKELRLPDTFNSWFLVTELHVWMLMAMLMGEPKHGRFLRNCMVEAMWEDVTTRAKKLGSDNTSIIRSQIQVISEEFQAALVSYDEGLLSNDTVLAGAIWRRFLNRNSSTNVEDIESMVKYVRQTMFMLDKWQLNEFMLEKKVNWIPVRKIFDELQR